MSSQEVYDVVIVGGGAVGLLTALYLEKKCSLKVALIEKRSFAKRPPEKPFTQQIALSVKSRQILEEIDLYPSVLPISVPLKDIHVSVKGRFGQLRMRPQKYGLEKFADVMSLYDFEVLLHEKLSTASRCRIIDGAEVTQIQFKDNCPQIHYQADAKAHVTGQLLIACDGANSSIKSLLNVQSQQETHFQEAIVGQIQISTAHQSRAYERFLKDGALALLPSVGRKVTFILTLPKDQIDALFDDEASLLARLQCEFGCRLGQFEVLTVKRRFSLNTSLAYGQVCQSVLFMGNAAHQLQPMAAQGLNLSIRDIQSLASALRWGIEQHKPINDYAILEKYLSLAKADQNQMNILVKALSKGMAQDRWPMAFKSVLLNMIEWCPPIKSKLTYRFMGVGNEYA